MLLSVDPSGWGMDIVLICYLWSYFPHKWKATWASENSKWKSTLSWNRHKSREACWRDASQLHPPFVYIESQSWLLETFASRCIDISMTMSNAVHTALVTSCWCQCQTLWLFLITGLDCRLDGWAGLVELVIGQTFCSYQSYCVLNWLTWCAH